MNLEVDEAVEGEPVADVAVEESPFAVLKTVKPVDEVVAEEIEDVVEADIEDDEEE